MVATLAVELLRHFLFEKVMSQIFRKPEHWYQPIDNEIIDRMGWFNSLSDDEKKKQLEGVFSPENETQVKGRYNGRT